MPPRAATAGPPGAGLAQSPTCQLPPGQAHKNLPVETHWAYFHPLLSSPRLLLFLQRFPVSIGYVRLALPLVWGPPSFYKGQDGVRIWLGKLVSEGRHRRASKSELPIQYPLLELGVRMMPGVACIIVRGRYACSAYSVAVPVTHLAVGGVQFRYLDEILTWTACRPHCHIDGRGRLNCGNGR